MRTSRVTFQTVGVSALAAPRPRWWGLPRNGASALSAALDWRGRQGGHSGVKRVYEKPAEAAQLASHRRGVCASKRAKSHLSLC